MKQMILISLLSLPQRLPLSSSIFFSFFVHREIERAAASAARSLAGRRPSLLFRPLSSVPLPFKGFYIHSATPGKIWLLSLLF